MGPASFRISIRSEVPHWLLTTGSAATAPKGPYLPRNRKCCGRATSLLFGSCITLAAAGYGQESRRVGAQFENDCRLTGPHCTAGFRRPASTQFGIRFL